MSKIFITRKKSNSWHNYANEGGFFREQETTNDMGEVVVSPPCRFLSHEYFITDFAYKGGGMSKPFFAMMS